MPETNINISEKLQKVSRTAEDYKNSLAETFKDMEVEVKNWAFNVGKIEDEYNVEVNVKLGFKPKSA
jgi:hypothetical protein